VRGELREGNRTKKKKSEKTKKEINKFVSIFFCFFEKSNAIEKKRCMCIDRPTTPFQCIFCFFFSLFLLLWLFLPLFNLRTVQSKTELKQNIFTHSQKHKQQQHNGKTKRRNQDKNTREEEG